MCACHVCLKWRWLTRRLPMVWVSAWNGSPPFLVNLAEVLIHPTAFDEYGMSWWLRPVWKVLDWRWNRKVVTVVLDAPPPTFIATLKDD